MLSTQKGFALLLSIIISSVVLSIGLTLLSVAVKQLNLSATGRESEIAFQMANLGMECARYHRALNAEDYIDGGPLDDLSIECAGDEVATNNETDTSIDMGNSNGTERRYSYRFNVDVGPEPRCIDLKIHVLNVTADVTNYPVGRIRTDCSDGNVCTVVVSQGYNRACNLITNSLFSVQRELTAEF